MSKPLISIVLPTYNGSKYIRQSIDSCLAQTFSNFELIIVNDCSTDNTLPILEEYALKDARVKVITNEKNKKLPLSLNIGFEIAQGEYFTWTSDDNIYAQKALESMLEIFKKDSSVDLVYADYYLINNSGQITGTREFGDINLSFTKWLGCGACFLYKSKVHFSINGYNPAAFLIEDYDFFVRAFTKFNFHYLPAHDLYYYREHDASLTAQHQSTINEISKIFLERNLSALESKLPNLELKYLYRKFAVYFSVMKNNAQKYNYYFAKLQSVSILQALFTAVYVFLVKFWASLKFGALGMFYFIRNLLKKPTE